MKRNGAEAGGERGGEAEEKRKDKDEHDYGKRNNKWKKMKQSTMKKGMKEKEVSKEKGRKKKKRRPCIRYLKEMKRGKGRVADRIMEERIEKETAGVRQ